MTDLAGPPKKNYHVTQDSAPPGIRHFGIISEFKPPFLCSLCIPKPHRLLSDNAILRLRFLAEHGHFPGRVDSAGGPWNN